MFKIGDRVYIIKELDHYTYLDTTQYFILHKRCPELTDELGEWFNISSTGYSAPDSWLVHADIYESPLYKIMKEED